MVLCYCIQSIASFTSHRGLHVLYYIHQHDEVIDGEPFIGKNLLVRFRARIEKLEKPENEIN